MIFMKNACFLLHLTLKNTTNLSGRARIYAETLLLTGAKVGKGIGNVFPTFI